MKIYQDKAKWYKFWRKFVSEDSVELETQFLYKIFDKYAPHAKSIIDLGGGTGIHAQKLLEFDYLVTVFDASKQLLDAVPTFSTLKTVLGKFEEIARILSAQKFDLAISMWTSFTYILDDTARREFFAWLGTNINELIVLDQSNFYLYPKSYSSQPLIQSIDSVVLKVRREFEIDTNYLRKGKYYIDVKSDDGSIDRFVDPEIMQFVPVAKLESLLGENWELVETYGDYDGSVYDQGFSKRLITVFKKLN